MGCWIEIAQAICPDPVVGASVFKPNASGSWELAGLRAMSERQLLKGSASYFAERVLVAVTTIEVVVIDVGLTGLIRPHRRSWRRDELVARAVANRDARVPLPAVLLGRRYGYSHVELAPHDADPSTISVLDRLLARSVVRPSRES